MIKVILFRFMPLFALLLLSGLLVSCDNSGSGVDYEYTNSSSWSCGVGEACQDVFDIVFDEGSVVTFTVHNVSEGSVSQIALYGPEVALGGTNLFTSSTDELRCREGVGCNDYTGGESVTAFIISDSGSYRFAITRNYDNSCGTSGTYDINITSSKNFVVSGQTVDDVDSLASGYSCP